MVATVDLQQVNKADPNGFQAVKDLSLDVREGEFMVTSPAAPCASPGRSSTTRLRRTATARWLFQNHALYPHMTVAENIVPTGMVTRGSGEIRPAPTMAVGGSPYNVAVGLARLGHGPTLMARLADTAFGRILRDHAQAEGIDLHAAPHAAEPSTLAVVFLDAMEETGRIDRAGPIRTVWSIILPMALPGLFTAAIICFTACWTEEVRDLRPDLRCGEGMSPFRPTAEGRGRAGYDQAPAGHAAERHPVREPGMCPVGRHNGHR